MSRDPSMLKVLYSREASGLVRHFQWWHVLMLTVAAPTGSGIFYYAVRTSAFPGGDIKLAFLIGMALFLPFVLASSALATAMPRSGGPYVAVARVVHPYVGYLAALFFVVGNALLIGVLGYLLMAISGGLLSGAGHAYGSEGLIALGQTLTSDTGKVVGGVVWVALFWVLMLQSPRYFRLIMGTFLVLPLLATLFAIATFVMASPVEARAGFDAVWGGQWDAVIETARAWGWAPVGFSWNSTFGLLLVVIWAFNGVEFATYVGGEVRSPSASILRGVLAGWLVVGILYLATAGSVHSAFADIAEPYDYLYSDAASEKCDDPEGEISCGQEALFALIPNAPDPSVPFYLMALLKSPVLALSLGLVFVLWFAKIVPAIFLSTSRLIFGLAMDRRLPEAFGNVTKRTNAPSVATHAAALLGVGGVFVMFLQVNVVLGGLMFLTTFITWPVGLACILLPHRMPELLPPRWRKQVLGQPLLTWVGGAAFVVGVLFSYLTVRELTWPVAAVLIGLFAAASLNYYLQTRGVADQAGTGGLLPPE